MHREIARSRHAHGANAGYVKEPGVNLVRRAGFAGLAYSDGDAAERHVLAAIRGARDRSTFSEELREAIVDWPSEYHLSRERHCLIRPLGIAAGDRVLELGCGCGAITRYLGETGAVVSAVEGAPARARIAAERCSDLPNVSVFVDDLLTFESDERFDWVLLVGVLEYAAVFSDARDAAAQMLRAAGRFLAPGGRLAIAIENQLGLKYFSGCAEDHVGIPFYGVQGLYEARSPRTFGRAELSRLVGDAGLPHAAFLYPFPDYKLPRIVLSEAALSDRDFDAAGTLAQVRSRDYGGNESRLFEEALVAAEAARNGLLGALSNSFLVVASRQALPVDDVLAVAFSAQRTDGFAIQTQFVRDGDAIRVRKSRLCPGDARKSFADGSVLQQSVGETDYVRGPLAFRALTLARARRGDLATIVAALSPWFDFLLAHAKASGPRLSDFSLPSAHLDATPFNVVETHNGPVPIDQEWSLDRDIALGWVITRGVLHCLWGIAGFECAPVMVDDVVRALGAQRGLAVSADEIAGWLAREDELQRLTSGRGLPARGGFASRQLVPPAHVTAQEVQIARLSQAVGALQGELDRVRGSRSWRYSHPLRAGAALVRQYARRSAPAKRYGFAAAAAAAILLLSYLTLFHAVRTPHASPSSPMRIDQIDGDSLMRRTWD